MKLNNLFVSFHHENHTAESRSKMDKANVAPTPKSSTTCTITSDERPDVPVHAIAMLHEGDNFCRETGRKISLGRALRAFGLSKEQRTAVWEAYRTSSPKPRWTRK